MLGLGPRIEALGVNAFFLTVYVLVSRAESFGFRCRDEGKSNRGPANVQEPNSPDAQTAHKP